MSIDPETTQRIWAEVQANQLVLDGCPRHDFRPVPGTQPTRERCTHCGGVLPGASASWYPRGLLHGRRP